MAPPSPSLRLIDSRPARIGSAQPVRSVALIGNYPPRRCGIATFTCDVRAALLRERPGLVCDVYAMTDGDNAYTYPEEVRLDIRQDRPEDYLRAAAALSASRPDMICVEHEFGIFGGPAGEHLMLILDTVDCPVISTLHTVLEEPNDDQRRAFNRLLARSARVLVMAERGREILRRVWKVDDSKIAVIAHGAPDMPLSDPGPYKDALGFSDHDVLFTFGLLSANKGIETVIRALPAIVAADPKALYVVLGATHPHLVAQEGERYRQSLLDLADSLGVSEHLQLIDAYTDTPELLRYLQAADVYVTPYLNPAQITSGTLSYAAALGKPAVSTPYWHAEELLGEGRGRLVEFGDSDAFAREIIQLLSNPAERDGLRERIYRHSRGTIWSVYAQHVLDVFDTVQGARKASQELPRSGARPRPEIGAVRRMTDSCGIMQHSLFGVPDRRHGYCVDDNARALILMHRLPGGLTEERRSLISVYAAFVQHAWNDDENCFRNFMSYERGWLEACGSEDSCGRAAMAVAIAAAEGADPLHQRWAHVLMSRILPHLETLTALRANAFVLLGLAALLPSDWRIDPVRALATRKLKDLMAPLQARRDQGLPWFEPWLSYDNARLPEALLRVGAALDDQAATALGLETLEWLCRRQSAPGGQFLPVATADFGQPLDRQGLFDQQPLEAAATIDACEAAFAVTADPRWIVEADRAFAWFKGGNCLGVDMTTADGGCFDGLNLQGANENQGAESVLAFQAATCALMRLAAAAGPVQKTALDR